MIIIKTKEEIELMRESALIVSKTLGEVAKAIKPGVTTLQLDAIAETCIRDHGAMNAIISTEIDNINSLKDQLSKVPSMEGLELASKVSTKEPYFVGDENSDFKVAALDIGIKKNIIRNFVKRGAYVKVFPYDSSFEDLHSWNPDGYFISNGPGDPEPLKQAHQLAKEII